MPNFPYRCSEGIEFWGLFYSITWGRFLLIHSLRGRYELAHTYVQFGTCKLTILLRTLKKISKIFRPRTHMAFAVETDNCTLLEICKAVLTISTEGQIVLMTKMSLPGSLRTSKNVFNFSMCYHVRRRKRLVMYYLLHLSCTFIYFLSCPTSPSPSIQTSWLSSTLITLVIIIIITVVLIIIVIVTLFFFVFTFSVSFTG